MLKTKAIRNEEAKKECALLTVKRNCVRFSIYPGRTSGDDLPARQHRVVVTPDACGLTRGRVVKTKVIAHRCRYLFFNKHKFQKKSESLFCSS